MRYYLPMLALTVIVVLEAAMVLHMGRYLTYELTMIRAHLYHDELRIRELEDEMGAAKYERPE